MNKIKNDRRFSHPNAIINFTNYLQKYNNQIKPNLKANKIRTSLLLFINKEYNELKKKKDDSLINHMSIIEAEKKYYNETHINLKTKTYSQFNMILRGEGKSSLNIHKFPQTFNLKDDFSPFKIKRVKLFKRKSLAQKKIMRFKSIINNIQDPNSSYLNELSTSDSLSPSQNINQTFIINGIKYLRQLAYTFKEINKKKKKKRHSVFENEKFRFGKIKEIE